MFVSALPDPTCNSEKSANGGNKQILLLLLLLLLLFPSRVMENHFATPLSVYGLFLIWTTDTKFRPQRVNSDKLNLIITDTTVIR